MGASVTTDSTVDCSAPALAIAHLKEEEWVRTIIAAEPAGWNTTIGALKVPHGGKTVHMRVRGNIIFE